jgi:hypothetical protein
MSDEDEVYLSLYLHCVLAESDGCTVKAKFAYRVPSANYSDVLDEHVFCRTNKNRGFPDFLLR